MALAELETVSRLQLAIVVIVFNDSALSLIRIKQAPHGHGGDAAVHYRDTRLRRGRAGHRHPVAPRARRERAARGARCSVREPGPVADRRGRRSVGVSGRARGHAGRPMTVSAEIARWVAGLAYEDVPAESIEAAKLHLLDTLGAGLAAHARGVATAGPVPRGHPRLGLLDRDRRAEARPRPRPRSRTACSATGSTSTIRTRTRSATSASSSRPRRSRSPRQQGASGRELLTALVAGSEIITRIGAAAVPGYMVRGFHPTSVCGVFGATVAAARLRGLAPAQITSALGLAGSMSAGLFAYLGDGSATKPVHAGWAAHGGIMAAELAAAGARRARRRVRGPVRLLRRLLRARREQRSSSRCPTSAGASRRRASRSSRIPPATSSTAASTPQRACSPSGPLAADEIERITVAVPDPGIPLVLEPVEAKRDPRTEYDAKFSLQYSIAALVVHGHVGVETYTEQAIRDPAVLELAAAGRARAAPVPDLPAVVPGLGQASRPAPVCVLERELAHQRGGPENPMGVDEVASKFRANAALALGRRGARPGIGSALARAAGRPRALPRAAPQPRVLCNADDARAPLPPARSSAR